MKKIIEFNLPDDSEDFDICNNAGKYYCIIWDFKNHLRSKLKYSELSDKERIIYEDVTDKLYELIDQHGIIDF